MDNLGIDVYEKVYIYIHIYTYRDQYMSIYLFDLLA